MARLENLKDFFTADELYALFYACLIFAFLFFLLTIFSGPAAFIILEIALLLLTISAIIGVIASRVKFKEELRKRR